MNLNVANSLPSYIADSLPSYIEEIPEDFYDPAPPFTGDIKQQIRKIYEAQEPSFSKNKPTLVQLQTDPFASHFLSRDPLLSPFGEINLACKSIETPISNSLGFRRHIVNLNLTTYGHDHAKNLNPNLLKSLLENVLKAIEQGPFVTENSDRSLPLTSSDLLKNILKKIDEDNTISSLLTAILREIVKENFLLAIEDFPAILHPELLEVLCQSILDSKQYISRNTSLGNLANVIFPYLTYEEMAKIKVIADFICFSIALNKKLLPEHLLDFQHENPYESGEYKSRFEALFETLQQKISTFSDLSEVEDLDLSSTYIETLSPSICSRLTNIKKLNFQKNNSASIPLLSSIATMSSLEEIDLSNNQFKALPPSFFDNLPNLQKLNLANNDFSKLKKAIIQNTCSEKGISLSI